MLSGTDALKVIRFVAFTAVDDAPSPFDDRHSPRSKSDGPWLWLTLAAALLVAGSAYVKGMRGMTGGAGAEQGVTTAVPSFPSQAAEPSEAPLPDVGEILTTEPSKITKPSPPVISDPSDERAKVRARDTRTDAGIGQPRTTAAHSPGNSGETMNDAGSTAPHAGPMVRVGRFATADDARKGWSLVLHRWPGMGRLPSVAVPIKSLRDGRTYYRLQVQTTSTAHSEVVCQRAHDLDQSCTVVGSPEGTNAI